MPFDAAYDRNRFAHKAAGLTSRYEVWHVDQPKQWLRAQLKLSETQRFHKIVFLSPELAQLIWEHNTDNRRLRRRLASRYGRTIASGRWRLTAEPLCFDYTGRFMEGQHRLKAILEAGIGAVVTIWFGCEPDEFKSLNRVLGHKYENILAAMGGMSLRLKAGNASAIFEAPEVTAEADRMASQDKGLMKDACQAGVELSKAHPPTGIKPTAGAYAFWYITNESDAETDVIEQFFEELQYGSENPSIRKVREELTDPKFWARGSGWDHRDNITRQTGTIVNAFIRYMSPVKQKHLAASKTAFLWNSATSLPKFDNEVK